MTVRELEQLFYVERMIAYEREKLEDLREATQPRSPILSDMPRAPGARDKIGDTVPEIAFHEERLRELIAKRDRLRRYIYSVPNERMQMILCLRYIEQKKWQEVADIIGGKETEYSVKHTVYRYVERMP